MDSTETSPESIHLEEATSIPTSVNPTSVINPDFRTSIINLAVRSIDIITADTNESASMRAGLMGHGGFVMDVLLGYAAVHTRTSWTAKAKALQEKLTGLRDG